MVGTSKTLNVSYGTFSCTLEGFDDSFNTMKAIAEYFRGLAADDRYFGADPPDPDAELLAKIAEAEILRRVDATMDDDGITLRAAALTDKTATDVAPEHDAAEKADRQAAKRVARQAARKAEREAERAQAEADAKAAEADHDTTPQNSTSQATPEDAEETTGSEVEETREDTGTAPAAHPDADSVAAKLQRIRAVVSTASLDENAPSDELNEQFLPQSEGPDVADEIEASDDVHDVISDDMAEDDTAQDVDVDRVSDEDETNDRTDMISRVMARHKTVDEDAQTAVSQDAETDLGHSETGDDKAAGDEMAGDDTAPQRPRVARMKRADFEKAKAAQSAAGQGAVSYDSVLKDTVEDTPYDSSTGPNLALLDGAYELDDYLEDSDFADDVATDDMLDVTTSDLVQNLAAIRSDDTTDVAEPAGVRTESDAIDSAETPSPAQPKAEAYVLSQSDKMAEDANDDAVTHDEPKAEMAEVQADDGQDGQTQDHGVDDESFDRLMDKIDAQMAEPEGSRRRDAIAQLKAAVAAKEASRQLGEAEDGIEDVENAFRNDLSEAVTPSETATPRRPVVRSTNRTERPSPPPLKLVAAQRVDLDETRGVRDGPVILRRVGARKAETTDTAAAGSFAEFAENMGASELPDLLEAAAAYTAFVEGADEFSRPQILRRVRAVSPADFKREDELRSFAELISAGRFTKVRNGRFQVADDSRFNPERRVS